MLVTLAEAKTYMGLTSVEHDDEINRYIAQADGVIQSHAGPAIQRDTFVERYSARRDLLLNRYPVESITSIGTVGSDGLVTPLDASSYHILDARMGKLSLFSYGLVEVTYVAGSLTPPAEAVDAALVFISYKYRRNHGGSESYMPAGQDAGISPPMGVDALTRQIRLALGDYARGPSVA
jgi:hypothetical protein